MDQDFEIRRAVPGDYQELGQLMVAAYAALDGFPKPDQAPEYFAMLANIGDLARKPATELWVAAAAGTLLGGVVYFSDMAQYGSGGTATRERDASGFRLLAVAQQARGRGVGRALMEACIERARTVGHRQMIIHTTAAMGTAWAMYEKRGFLRSEDLDFIQGPIQVYGFRLHL
jgi:GNAT superfamily N-acetyltransferase